MAADLTATEQQHVRVALRALRFRFGTWAAVADALHYRPESMKGTACGRAPITPTVAFRVARLANVGIDDLLAGKFRLPGQCAACGHVAQPEEADSRRSTP